MKLIREPQPPPDDASPTVKKAWKVRHDKWRALMREWDEKEKDWNRGSLVIVARQHHAKQPGRASGE